MVVVCIWEVSVFVLYMRYRNIKKICDVFEFVIFNDSRICFYVYVYICMCLKFDLFEKIM